MSAQTISQPANIPLVACPACEKKPLMVIKSVTPHARSREADVEFVCASCGVTRTEVTAL